MSKFLCNMINYTYFFATWISIEVKICLISFCVFIECIRWLHKRLKLLWCIPVYYEHLLRLGHHGNNDSIFQMEMKKIVPNFHICNSKETVMIFRVAVNIFLPIYISELLARDYIKKLHPTNISYHTCNINKSTWHMSSQNHFRCF